MEIADEKPDLHELRMSRGWTQQEVADKAGISRSYYAVMETQGRTPSVKVAHKLAQVFKLNWQSFFDQLETK